MSHVQSVFTSGEGSDRPRLPRPLDPVEIRVLGSLLEKQQATPAYYPMTVNSLVAACNQKSNREPVMELSEGDVSAALLRLQDELLVWRVVGSSRAVHWDHNLDRKWFLDPAGKAILTLLFLRGPQTPGELRSRSDRLRPFETLEEVERSLEEMASSSAPLVVELPRRPGQKESRWAHLISGTPAADVEPQRAASTNEGAEPMAVRVARLEEHVARLTRELAELKGRLGEG